MESRSQCLCAALRGREVICCSSFKVHIGHRKWKRTIAMSRICQLPDLPSTICNIMCWKQNHHLKKIFKYLQNYCFCSFVINYTFNFGGEGRCGHNRGDCRQSQAGPKAATIGVSVMRLKTDDGLPGPGHHH